MIILHASESDGALVLWSEESRTEGRRGRRGRMPKAARAPMHPFAARSRDVMDVLGESVLDARPDQRRTGWATAWLPSGGNRPFPSSGLVGEPPGRPEEAALAPWSVPTYRPTAQETVALLCAAMGRRTLASGVVVGSDLANWAEALRLAGSAVARQRYLPGLAARGEEHFATWEPLLHGRDEDFLDRLARRMPPSARALSGLDAAEPANGLSGDALRRFVAAMTDHLVRIPVAGRQRPTTRRRKRPSFDSIHDAWLHGLTSDDGRVAGDESEIARLAATVREWWRPIGTWANAPYRLCFRLEEPEGSPEVDETPEDGWRVRFLLQHRDDPSLLIPVEEAWNGGGGALPSLNGMGDDINTFLLTSLGQAALIWPAITHSLENASLAGFSLDTAGAHRFLTRDAIALEQSGFGVMLPAWWTRKGTITRLAAHAEARPPKMRAGAGLTLDTIVKFDWQVALGDHTLTRRELQALARAKTPLVRVRGRWVEMNADEIKQALDFWRKRGREQITVRDVIRMAVGAEATPNGFDFRGVKSMGGIKDLLDQLDGQANFEELESPTGLDATLRPYQARGYSWLSFLRQWGLGACLADDMGLGKTIQTLALIQRDWQAGARSPVLLLCPTSVASNWRREADRFTPDLPVLVHHGSGRKRGQAFKKAAATHAMVVSSYGLAHRDIGFLSEVAWGGVVLDEAQNIKNPQTLQARAARSLKAGYRVALTGTPVENNVGDLWSIMEFLNPGFLGSQAEFKRNYFVPIQAERDAAAIQGLKRVTGPFILRRLKTDKSIISDLPEKHEMKVFCSLTREQASLYASVVDETEEALESADGIDRRGLILATLSKLKQVCNHPAQFLADNSAIANRSGKLARLTEMMEEIVEVGDRALVFTQFTEMGGLIQRHLQETFGREVLFLHGGVSRGSRDRMVERFQSGAGGPRFFILSLRAGGAGLNLTAANHVFHFDRWWNPAVENQATDRAFRIGQERNVQVHKFICAGTLEERIDEMMERKSEIVESVVGAGEGWLTELSNDDLRQLLALSQEAGA